MGDFRDGKGGWKVIWAKHHKSMYEGSLVGAGAVPFAIMGYILSHQELDGKGGSVVRLQPVILAATLGETQADVEKGIEFLCSPDKKSHSPAEEGRRIVKVGEFDYRVVNGAYYQGLRNDEERREQNRVNQARWREKHKDSPKRKRRSKPAPIETGEGIIQRAIDRGDSPAEIDKLRANIQQEIEDNANGL